MRTKQSVMKANWREKKKMSIADSMFQPPDSLVTIYQVGPAWAWTVHSFTSLGHSIKTASLRLPPPSLLPCFRTVVMWRSEQGNHHGSTNNGVASSSSSSSSSSRSSLSSTTSTLLPQAPKRRTMEEVWKEIGLRSLHHQERLLTPLNHQRHSPTASPSFRAIILQDFLAGPLNRPHAAAKNLPLPPSTMPPTALSLSPRLEIKLMGSDAHGNSNFSSNGCRASFISPAFSDNMVRPPSPIGLFSFCSKEAMSEDPTACGDLRHKRMIKNRESAARSRARKQAYINELELDVARLLEEQSRLQKELEELRLAMAAKYSKRNTLRRSSTAPF